MDEKRHTTNLVRPTNPFVEWSKESTEHSIPYHFRRQARARPDQTAVKVGGYEATYKALDGASNRVAQAILARREKAPCAVALLLGNDNHMFEAVLGTLKAGMFYVPLDPSYPIERNRYIAEDSGADLVVTTSDYLQQAAHLVKGGGDLINIDETWAHQSDEDPNLEIGADEIAFIHYTSGSTGQPKGVIYTHRNVQHIVLRYTNGQHISPDDRLSLLYSYSYGASVGNIYGGLLNGATVCVFNVKEEGPDKLARWLIKEGVSIYYSVPTVFRHFAEGLTGEKFPRLRLIRLGGETVYKSDLELFKNRFPDGCLLHVGFGTTESNVARECFFDRHAECLDEIVPVGYPVEDMEVLLLDERGEPVGFDCIGEIAVRSRYISPGYWHRPELTKKVFLPDPEDASRQTYLTGDLGRMLPDGCLIHVGRKDSQLKVRGFRIEAAEVEVALLSLSGVKEAVVIARESHSGEKRLAAYVVAINGSTINADELRAALRKSLPDFMVPADFTTIAELPRTPSGKIDRRQLQSLSPSPSSVQSNFMAPRNPVEQRLKQIWEEALNVRPVGIADDFFNLGGDSLSAAEIFAEIEAVYGKGLPASTLLQAATIEQLARLVVTGEDAGSSLVPIKACGSGLPFFCVHGIGGDVISFIELAKYLGDDRPFYGLRASASSGSNLSVESMATRYIKEIQRQQPEGPYFLGGYSFGGTIAFEMARQLVEQGKTVGFLALLDTYGPGYPKLLPVRERASIHWRVFQRAEASEKLVYLRDRIKINAIRAGKGVRKVSRRYANKATVGPPTGMARDLTAAHQRAHWDYVPKRFSGRIDLFRAVNQKEIWHRDNLLGWGGLASGGIEVHDIPGDHTSMLTEPDVAILAEKLRECLSKWRQ